jgi:hypothetical protein
MLPGAPGRRGQAHEAFVKKRQHLEPADTSASALASPSRQR